MSKVKIVRRKSDGAEFLYSETLMKTGNFIEATIETVEAGKKADKTGSAENKKQEAPAKPEAEDAGGGSDDAPDAALDALGDNKKALIDYAQEMYGLTIAPSASVKSIRKQIADVKKAQ